MYVGRRHTATVTAKTLLPYSCPNCRHEAFALVTGVGQGQGQSPYFLDESGAKERAGSQAEASARENAELTLSLARCPSCQRIDANKLGAVKGKTIAGSVACVVVFPVFGLILDALHGGRSSVGLVIFVPLGLLTAWLVYAQQKWKWETVENRVLFVSAEELSAALDKSDAGASD